MLKKSKKQSKCVVKCYLLFVTFSHKLSCYSCKAVVDHGVYTWFNQKKQNNTTVWKRNT